MYKFPREPFCHECHRKCCGYFCSNCARCYCSKCTFGDNIGGPSHLHTSSIIKMCSICIQLQESRKRWSNGIAFKPMKREAMRLLFTRVFKDFSRVPKLLNQDESFFRGRINAEHEPFTFIKVAQKIRNLSYQCSEELVIDLKTIQHILLSSPLKNFDQDQVKIASSYLQKAIGELQFANLCPYCSLNYEEKTPTILKDLEKFSPLFVSPCPWPHTLVLAKAEGNILLNAWDDVSNQIFSPGYTPWPAKILFYNAGEKLVDVIFFGTYEWCSVELRSVFYARDPHQFPGDYGKIRAKVAKTNDLLSKFDISTKELKEHIKHLKLNFPEQIKLTTEYMKPWLPTDSLFLIDQKVYQNNEVEKPVKNELFENHPVSCVSPSQVDAKSSMLLHLITSKNVSTDHSVPSKRIEVAVKSCSSPEEGIQQRFDNFCENLNSNGLSSIETEAAQEPNSSQNHVLSSSKNNFPLQTENSTPYETPESLENGELLNCLTETGDCSSPMTVEVAKNDSLGSVPTDLAISPKSNKRSASSSGHSENFNMKFKCCESNDLSSEDENEQLDAIKYHSIPYISSICDPLFQSEELIETQPEGPTAPEDEASINSPVPSSSSMTSSILSPSNRFTVEFSDQDDEENNESLSDIFGNVDHRIIDKSEDEGPELSMFTFPELSEISDDEME